MRHSSPLLPVRLSQWFLLGLGVFVLRSSSPIQGAESVQIILRSLQNKISAVKSMEATLDISATFTKPNKKKETFKGTGKLFTQIPDQLHLDLSANVVDPDREGPVKFVTEIVLDGKTLWLLVRNSHGKTSFLSSFDFTKLKEEFPEVFSTRGLEGYFNPADELNELDLTRVQFLGRTSLDGRPMVVLESTLKRSVPVSFLNLAGEKSPTPGKVRVWIGSEDGVTYQTLMYNQSGKKAGTIRLSNVHLHVGIDPGIFQFLPPEGTTPVDMTPTLEEELRHKGESNRR